ncbi:MAG TPA: hypothetical protein VFC46_08265, partial [Humisphaera sp.]|nr:hypothetical protein [Humisphaera sp.]
MPLKFLPRSILAIGLVCLICGCAAQPSNPSFPITDQQADCDLHRIAAAPKPLDRPLVVIGGFMDPGIASAVVRTRFEGLTRDKRIIDVELGTCLSFDDCRAKIIDAVERAFPGHDPSETTPVDVIGLSMGGLAARYSALPTDPAHRKRLHIARLFTISSPLNGAQLAKAAPDFLPLVGPMRPGSHLLREVNATQSDYPIFSYVRLGDNPVGVAYAAPPGHVAWWLSSPPLNSAHIGALVDPRILTDIARRRRIG